MMDITTVEVTEKVKKEKTKKRPKAGEGGTAPTKDGVGPS